MGIELSEEIQKVVYQRVEEYLSGLKNEKQSSNEQKL